MSFNINPQVNNQLKLLKPLFVLVAIFFACLLIIQAFSLSQSQFDYQNTLMDSVSKSVLEELTQELSNQKLKISLFHSENKSLLSEFRKQPEKVDNNSYMLIYEKVRQTFPTSRLYTLISSDGRNLLEHITGSFLDDCNKEVMETVKLGRQRGLFLHRSKTSAHYDLIQPVNQNDVSQGYLFIAFNIDFFIQLLKKYQLPYQQLYLLRNDKQGFIEVSSESEATGNESSYLDQKTMAKFEHILAIPDTRWSFAIKLNPKTKSEFLNKALLQALVTWFIVSLLLYLAMGFIKKNIKSKFKAENALAKSEENAAIILNSVSESIIAIDAKHQITFANQAAASLLEKEQSCLLTKNISNVCVFYNQAKNIKVPIGDIIKATIELKTSNSLNLILKTDTKNDIPIGLKLAVVYSPDNEQQGYSITIENLSNAVELSKRMAFHEKHDKLTQLFNRQYLENKIQNILKHKKLNLGTINSAIILIDFDKFKLLNSSHGFEAGDQFLKRIAKLLSETLPKENLICRLSSDEFAVIAEQTNEMSLQLLCNQIKTGIRNFKFEWHQEIISASVCLGVVIIDEHFNNTDEILAAADHACRLAKSKGINVIQYYQTDDPDIKQRTDEINILVDLKKAIDEERLILFSQEIRQITHNGISDNSTAANKAMDNSLEQDQATGGQSKPIAKKFELLIRMIDSAGNIISPVQFIPAAEKYGLMAKIDRWVIENTFKQISQLGRDDRNLYSINISSKTLSDKTIIAFVEKLFVKYPVSAERINFEITETSAISYLDNALDFMHAMKEKGCAFSLDDFGTGLASFDYLKKLPIDFLKIDGIFVKDLENNPNDFAFIEAIHKISSQMGIATVAEFVENATILQMLATIGVDYAQGYYIHKPELWFTPKPLKK